jgi:hypothetical protein
MVAWKAVLPTKHRLLWIYQENRTIIQHRCRHLTNGITRIKRLKLLFYQRQLTTQLYKTEQNQTNVLPTFMAVMPTTPPLKQELQLERMNVTRPWTPETQILLIAPQCTLKHPHCSWQLAIHKNVNKLTYVMCINKSSREYQ